MTNETLTQLVYDNLNGATLVDAQETEVIGDEHVYVVLWKRETDGSTPRFTRTEWGTHRAVVNAETNESMLVWGHYYQEMDKAYKDYNARRAENT